MRKHELKDAIRILDGKHSSIARAWVEDKVVQFRQLHESDWIDCERTGGALNFLDECEYRIKPDPVKMQVAMFKNDIGDSVIKSERTGGFPDNIRNHKRISKVYTIEEDVS